MSRFSRCRPEEWITKQQIKDIRKDLKNLALDFKNIPIDKDDREADEFIEKSIGRWKTDYYNRYYRIDFDTWICISFCGCELEFDEFSFYIIQWSDKKSVTELRKILNPIKKYFDDVDIDRNNYDREVNIFGKEYGDYTHWIELTLKRKTSESA